MMLISALCVKLGKSHEISALYFWKNFPKYKFREKHWQSGCLNHLHRFTSLGVYADIRTKTLTHYQEYAHQCNNSPLEQQGVNKWAMIAVNCSSEIVLRRIQNNLAEMVIK